MTWSPSTTASVTIWPMTCDEMSTFVLARTRPLQLTVETSGTLPTFAVVTRTRFLSLRATDAQMTTARIATTAIPIAALIRVLMERLPSGANADSTACYGISDPDVSRCRDEGVADRGGFEPPVRF